MHEVVQEDVASIIENLGPLWERLAGKELLLTGYAGFLGYYFVACLSVLNDTFLRGRECRLIGVDNLLLRKRPVWLEEFAHRPEFTLVEGSALTPIEHLLQSAGWAGPARFVVHAASIASPTYYRMYPIETMDANVMGLRNVLQYVIARSGTSEPVESLLFFSSSEVYGDPSADSIPTSESYWGRVSFTGPRACYDESKRFGETLCVSFYRVHNVPVKIARPFNNFGPGLSLDDRRLIPDVMKNVLLGQDVVLHSDGSPTRAFCYVADAMTGYWQMLLSDQNGESFNIGLDEPELSARELAELVLRVARDEYHINGNIVCRESPDPNYLTDNPRRRCPSIEKARHLLGYRPCVTLEEGIRRTMKWYYDQLRVC